MYDSKAELVNLFLSFLPMNISLNSIVSQDQIKFEDGQCVKGGLVWDFFFTWSSSSWKDVCWVGESLGPRGEPSVPFQLDHELCDFSNTRGLQVFYEQNSGVGSMTLRAHLGC